MVDYWVVDQGAEEVTEVTRKTVGNAELKSL